MTVDLTLNIIAMCLSLTAVWFSVLTVKNGKRARAAAERSRIALKKTEELQARQERR